MKIEPVPAMTDGARVPCSICSRESASFFVVSDDGKATPAGVDCLQELHYSLHSRMKRRGLDWYLHSPAEEENPKARDLHHALHEAGFVQKYDVRSIMKGRKTMNEYRRLALESPPVYRVGLFAMGAETPTGASQKNFSPWDRLNEAFINRPEYAPLKKLFPVPTTNQAIKLMERGYAMLEAADKIAKGGSTERDLGQQKTIANLMKKVATRADELRAMDKKKIKIGVDEWQKTRDLFFGAASQMEGVLEGRQYQDRIFDDLVSEISRRASDITDKAKIGAGVVVGIGIVGLVAYLILSPRHFGIDTYRQGRLRQSWHQF